MTSPLVLLNLLAVLTAAPAAGAQYLSPDAVWLPCSGACPAQSLGLRDDSMLSLGSCPVDGRAGGCLLRWSGSVDLSGRALFCAAGQCLLTAAGDGSGAPSIFMLSGHATVDGVAVEQAPEEAAAEALGGVERLLLQALNVNLDLEGIGSELDLEEDSFVEKGVVSVEGGSACLDSANSGGTGADLQDGNEGFEKTPATLNIKIRLPKPEPGGAR